MGISKGQPRAAAGGSWTPLPAVPSCQGHLLPTRCLPFSQPSEIPTAEAVALGHGKILYAFRRVGSSVRYSS